MAALASNLKEVAPAKRWASAAAASRRTVHGGMVYAAAPNLIQPQDGAPERKDAMRVSAIGSRLHAALGAVTLSEPEDARLTGMTRSLVRRVMGLNMKPRTMHKKPVESRIKAAKPLVVASRVA